MERIKLTANLFLDEYIPKELYLSASDPAQLVKLIDPKLVAADQLLRDHFGPVTINNWWTGGDRHLSGFRPEDCAIGAKKSDHKRGMASDKIFKNINSEDVREFIKNNWKTLGITKIESGVSWVHTSVAPTGLNYLQIFKA
jgi:hypothetical protein